MKVVFECALRYTPAMFSLFAWIGFLSASASAHSFSTDLGTIESIQAGHYHFHLPVEFDLEGDLGFHFGSHDEDSHEHDEAHEGDSHSEHPGASVTLVFAADYDRIRREIVRTKHELPAESWTIPSADKGAPRFKVQARKFAIGLGPDAHLGAAAIGLLPGRETSFFHRIPCATPACEEKFDRRFPRGISEWIARPAGERMAYAKATGIHVTVMGGIHGVVSGGPAFLQERVWNVSLEKTETGLLEVSVSQDSLFSYGLEAENAVVALMPGKQTTKSRGFEYTLDPLSSEGAEAYRNILAGRLDRVPTERKSKSRAFARAFSAQAGIPILSGIGAESNRNTVTVESGEETLHVTVRQDGIRARGMASRHLLRGRYLIASVDEHALEEAHEHSAHADEEEGGGLSFTSLWIFERDRVSPERLGRWLRKLAKKAGLPELAFLAYPDENDGYLRGEMRILFPEDLIREWLELDGAEHKERRFVELPNEVKKGSRWRRILRRAHRAVESRDGRELSQAIEQAGVEWTKHFPAIRERAAREGRELPVIFELRLQGDAIPQTIKAWKLESRSSARSTQN